MSRECAGLDEGTDIMAPFLRKLSLSYAFWLLKSFNCLRIQAINVFSVVYSSCEILVEIDFHSF